MLTRIALPTPKLFCATQELECRRIVKDVLTICLDDMKEDSFGFGIVLALIGTVVLLVAYLAYGESPTAEKVRDEPENAIAGWPR